MYALAVKEKELRAIDIDTKQSVFVPIEVSLFVSPLLFLSMLLITCFRSYRCILRTKVSRLCSFNLLAC